MNLGIKQAIKDGNVCCIYLIISPTGKYYVGQTTNLKKRHTDYKNIKKSLGQRKLYNSFYKHGFENHSMSILKECTKEELNFWECFYIALFDSTNNDNGLNIREGGHYSKISEETKEILRQKNLGKKLTEQHKENIKKGLIGVDTRNKTKKIWTPELRAKWSELCGGEKNGHYGKGMKPHVKEKLLKINLGKKVSSETRKKQSEKRKGVPKSEEWKQKNRKPHKGYNKKNMDYWNEDGTKKICIKRKKSVNEPRD